jgi:hypothetical protein
MLSGQRKCALPQHPERGVLTNKFGPLMGGCTGHQGVVILRPLAGRFLRLHLENRKPATAPKTLGVNYRPFADGNIHFP